MVSKSNMRNLYLPNDKCLNLSQALHVSRTEPSINNQEENYNAQSKLSSLSTEDIILKNTLSLLDPLEIKGILCLGYSFKDDMLKNLNASLAYPKRHQSELRAAFGRAFDGRAFERFKQNIPSPFLAALWVDKDYTAPKETESISEPHFILTKSFGPKGMTAFFLLQMKDINPHINNSVLEHVQQITQAAFSKIVLLGSQLNKDTRLTPRETDIVKWIAHGKSNPEIADIMQISIHTVNGYLRAIYLKTQTSDRVSLGFYALQHGLLD